MVHYDPPSRYAVQRPSALCPKCGSHRTEIVGVSQDKKTAFLRCGACGARSEIAVCDTAAPAPAAG